MPETTHKIHADWATNSLLRFMRVKEELGKPFEIFLEVLDPNKNLDPYKVLYQPVAVSIRRPDGSQRFFHGITAGFVNVGPRNRFQLYELQVRPWIWFLSRSQDCRIYQNQSFVDILKVVANDKHGFSKYRTSTTETHAPWEYCVQYRESDFNFIHRLMEQEGLYYFFTHTQTQHELVIVDGKSGHQPIAGESKIPYLPPNEAYAGREHISYWQRLVTVGTGKVTLRDYAFDKPNVNLETRSQGTVKGRIPIFEVYDYPGEYSETSAGVNVAKHLLEAYQAQHARIEGAGHCPALATGCLFDLIEHPRSSENGKYLVTSSEIEVESGEIEQFEGAENRFETKFTTIPADVPFRLPRNTPKPTIAGPQTAVVVGKTGEDLWVDKFGRVKVQFHWDRLGQKDENSSCWIRVSQPLAGKNWGAVFLPRTGQEVIVEFLEGDPDRPIITGRVYNENQATPYDLPEKATQSGILTRSTKEGTAETANQLRFEDKKGEEEIYFHAEKNFNRVVENNDTLKVGFDKKEAGDQTIEVFNNQSITIGHKDCADGSLTLKIHKNRTETIETGDETLDIKKGSRTESIDKGNDTLTIGEGSRKTTISKGDETLEIAQGSCKINAVQRSRSRLVRPSL